MHQFFRAAFCMYNVARDEKRQTPAVLLYTILSTTSKYSTYIFPFPNPIQSYRNGFMIAS
jgi:hypothetical protein